MKKTLLCAAAILIFAMQPNAIARRPACPGGPGPWGGPHHGEGRKPFMNHQEMFEGLDIDGDGKLSREEADAGPTPLAARFDQLDADGDGFISTDEFRQPFQRPGLGMRGMRGMGAMSGHHFGMQLFMAADADKDQKLSKDEFTKAFPLMADKFAEYDLDGDGFITLEELHRHSFGQWRDEMSQKREQRFNDADKDKDGALSKEEFAAAFPRMADKFEAFDANKDGLVTREELSGPSKKLMRGPGPQIK